MTNINEAEVLTYIPQHNGEFEFQEDFLVNSENSNEVYYLNKTAFLIWGLCDGSMTIGEIIDDLSAAYPEQVEDLKSNAIETFKILYAAGIIK